jgi:hypothetical protein
MFIFLPNKTGDGGDAAWELTFDMFWLLANLLGRFSSFFLPSLYCTAIYSITRNSTFVCVCEREREMIRNSNSFCVWGIKNFNPVVLEITLLSCHHMAVLRVRRGLHSEAEHQVVKYFPRCGYSFLLISKLSIFRIYYTDSRWS